MEKKWKRIIMTIIGTVFTGVSVGILRKAQLGTDPFTAFVTGCANAVHSSYGVLYPVIIGILLILVFLIDKHYIGIGTILNLFIIGIVADVSLKILNAIYEADTWLIRGVTLAVAIFVLCFASSLYIAADLGVSSYDAVSLIMADKKIAQYRFCRIFTDVICVIIGYVLHAVDCVGIGTVITAFGMGPIVQFFIKHVSQKLLYGKEGKEGNGL
ncbi:MAG: Tat pathway signal sequence [Lachnospiraceae bacterium]|nr:Tat pathway signal sequence [Lachnospiraceae bacterium]